MQLETAQTRWDSCMAQPMTEVNKSFDKSKRFKVRQQINGQISQEIRINIYVI